MAYIPHTDSAAGEYQSVFELYSPGAIRKPVCPVCTRRLPNITTQKCWSCQQVVRPYMSTVERLGPAVKQEEVSVAYRSAETEEDVAGLAIGNRRLVCINCHRLPPKEQEAWCRYRVLYTCPFCRYVGFPAVVILSQTEDQNMSAQSCVGCKAGGWTVVGALVSALVAVPLSMIGGCSMADSRWQEHAHKLDLERAAEAAKVVTLQEQLYNLTSSRRVQEQDGLIQLDEHKQRDAKVVRYKIQVGNLEPDKSDGAITTDPPVVYTRYFLVSDDLYCNEVAKLLYEQYNVNDVIAVDWRPVQEVPELAPRFKYEVVDNKTAQNVPDHE